MSEPAGEPEMTRAEYLAALADAFDRARDQALELEAPTPDTAAAEAAALDRLLEATRRMHNAALMARARVRAVQGWTPHVAR